MLNDIYFEVKKALARGTMPALIAGYNADPGLKYAIAEKKVVVAPEAFYKKMSGVNSLEHIAAITRRTNREVAFAGIMDERDLTVARFIKGRIGDPNGCDWEKGALLRKAFGYAAEAGTKVSLGHNHPVFYNGGSGKGGGINRAYGAICSKIYYEKDDLARFADRASLNILKSGMYRRYGGDYCCMREIMRRHELISGFFWILSPRLDQAGVFEMKDGGRAVYHPWVIGEE